MIENIVQIGWGMRSWLLVYSSSPDNNEGVSRLSCVRRLRLFAQELQQVVLSAVICVCGALLVRTRLGLSGHAW